MKWAKCNLGATKPESYGIYFSWGNTDGHPAGAGYDFSQAVYDTTPAAAINANLSLNEDAARAYLGTPWRMPTADEFAELFNSQYTEFVDASGNVISGTDKRTTYNGVVGLLLRSKTNSNTLFFPATGLYEGTSLDGRGSRGYYWASTWLSSLNARDMYFTMYGVYYQDSGNRRFGRSVRAVQDGTPNRSVIPPTPEKDEETPTVEEPKDDNER